MPLAHVYALLDFLVLITLFLSAFSFSSFSRLSSSSLDFAGTSSSSHLLFRRSASAWPLIFSSPSTSIFRVSMLRFRLRLRLGLARIFPTRWPELGLRRRKGEREGEGLRLRRRPGVTLRRLSGLALRRRGGGWGERE